MPCVFNTVFATIDARELGDTVSFLGVAAGRHPTGDVDSTQVKMMV